MRFCILEPPSKKIFYFIGYITFVFLREKLERELNSIYKSVEAEDFELTIFYTIGDLFCGIFVYIVQKRTNSIKIDKLRISNKSKNSKKSSNGKINLNEINSLIYNDEESTLKFNSLKRVFYLSVYDILAQSCSFIFCFIYKERNYKTPHHNINISLIVDIASRFILNKVMLGSEFYPHYYLSITIAIFSFIILSASDLYFMLKEIKLYSWIYLLLFTLKTILYSLENVEGKKGLNYEFLNVYNLLFYKGIIQSIILLIASIVFIALKKYYLFIDLFVNENHFFKTFIIIFFYIILNMLSNISIWKIVDIYGIQHLTIARGGICFVFFIKALIENKLEYQNIEKIFIFFFTDIFGYILLFIATLIHNEIIILNCGSLGKFTYKKLKEREKTDLLLVARTQDSTESKKSEIPLKLIENQKSGQILKLSDTSSEETFKSNDTQNSGDTLKLSETQKSGETQNFEYNKTNKISFDYSINDSNEF